MEAKKSKKLTGDGKSPHEPNATQQKILNLCEETQVLQVWREEQNRLLRNQSTKMYKSLS